MSAAPEQWARFLIRRGRECNGDAPLPAYGSPAWSSAPQAVKVAATVVAAECWRRSGEPEVIRAEVQDRRAAAEKIAGEEFAAMAAKVRRTASTPTHDELMRRRVQAGAVRPGDYPGRALGGAA